MKYFITRAMLLLMFAICSFEKINAQSGTITGTGTITYLENGATKVDGDKLFTSYVAMDRKDALKMVTLDALSLFSISADLTGGIKAQVGADGFVQLIVYAYSENTRDRKGNIIYSMTLTKSSSTYGGVPKQVPCFGRYASSDDIVALLQGADTYFIDPSKVSKRINTNLFKTSLVYYFDKVPPDFPNDYYSAVKGNNYSPEQPIIVEVAVKNSTVDPNGIKIPGLFEEFDLANYFDPNRDLTVSFFLNGKLVQTNKSGNVNPTIIGATMGDSISYEVTYNGTKPPRVEGIPSVWIARFAGDLMYYCSPNTNPGEFNPWIGYDSRVHNMQLRRYDGDPNFTLKVADWERSGNVWSWGTVAQRRMDARKDKYQAAYTWIKYKTLKSGAKQRNNQREGLNIQFLDYWQNGLNSNYNQYRGVTKYIMGFDDDELFYLNSQHYDAKLFPPGPGGGIAKLDSIPSRGMPEGYEQIYDIRTGYPTQGFPLNIIVSAYKMNREINLNRNTSYHTNYDGYEIQDNGTSEKYPLGDGTGNVAQPGVIKFHAGNKVVEFRLTVVAPLTTDKGMYGSLIGNMWPGYYEKENKYTLIGLKGKSIEELNKYSMTYEGTDALGNISRQIVNLKELSQQEKLNISNNGEWTASFDNTNPTYACVSAFYQRTPTSSKVIIAGKELKSIFLLFFGESNLEGKGLGAKIWLNDFRSKKYGDFTVPRKFGNETKYMTPFVRTYTFHTNTTTTFEAWDGDPHLFYDPGVEWFLSSRTLAERIPDSYLDGTAPGVTTPYLKYYINGVEQKSGRSGKKFTYTWKTPGEYVLRVEYRSAGNLTAYQHKIVIIDYPPLQKLDVMAKIVPLKLTANEATWFNIKNPDDYRIFEVQDVYSDYEYKSGPRACVPYINRWADHNDYASRYAWTVKNAPEQTGYLINYSDLDWFWKYWALHYSSNWRDNLPNGLPPYVPNDLVTRIIGSELDKFATPISRLFDRVQYAKWQYTVPLVSYTDFQGNRMRTNPSCIYDINYMWNNAVGAFSGQPVLPPSSSYIQAPDITDDQKDRQDLYCDLKSGRKILVYVKGQEFTVGVTNAYLARNMITGETIKTDTFISDYHYKYESDK